MGSGAVILTADQVSQHSTATWALPPGVTAELAEVAISPLVGSDRYFFAENRKAFDVLQDAQTTWTSTYQLDPGTYYIHIAGLESPCFFASACAVREFSQIPTDASHHAQLRRQTGSQDPLREHHPILEPQERPRDLVVHVLQETRAGPLQRARQL
jgi:hypothetical protein